MMAQIHIPTDIKELHPRCFALEVSGDSMAPTVPAGAVVVVDPDTQPPRDGSEIGVVEVCGDLHICRPMHVMGQVVMFRDSKGYPPVTLPDSRCRVVGAVVLVSGAVAQIKELQTTSL